MEEKQILHSNPLWYSGTSSESYTNGPFATKDAAIAALNGKAGFVILGSVPGLDLSPLLGKGRDVLAHLWEKLEEQGAISEEIDDFPIDITEDQANELAEKLAEVLRQWQNSHELRFSGGLFDNCSDEEAVNG